MEAIIFIFWTLICVSISIELCAMIGELRSIEKQLSTTNQILIECVKDTISLLAHEC